MRGHRLLRNRAPLRTGTRSLISDDYLSRGYNKGNYKIHPGDRLTSMASSSNPATKDSFEFTRYPLPIRMINSAGNTLAKLGIRLDISQAKLLAHAQSKGRSSYWGDTDFEEPLSLLLESIKKEASLNFVGRFMARQMISAALVNRLRIQSRSQEQPELLDTPIERPLFITGYPRTGTTLLQHLLALDTQNRTPKMYEALSPVPPDSLKDQRDNSRIRAAERFVKMAHYISPQVPVIHALNARGPDECLKLIENTFISPHFAAYFNVPTYWKWLLSQDPGSFTPVYAYHRRQLQILSQGQMRTGWVLKAPLHLFFLEALVKTYPDARIVFLHRDPRAAVPSFCSLLSVSRAMATDRVDPKQIGEFALDLYETSYERAAQARATMHDPAQVLDIDYQALVNNPMATVLHIYKHFGDTPDSHLEQSIEEWLEENPQHKHGVHRYSTVKYSLDHRHLERLPA